MNVVIAVVYWQCLRIWIWSLATIQWLPTSSQGWAELQRLNFIELYVMDEAYFVINCNFTK